METHNLELTEDELLAELLTDIGEIEQPGAADGWFRIEALMTASDSAQGEDFFRRRAKKLVKSGEWERKDFKKIAYYRRVK
jgi:hypothetical protein